MLVFCAAFAGMTVFGATGAAAENVPPVIAGDECLSYLWKTCPACQALMKREGMKDMT